MRATGPLVLLNAALVLAFAANHGSGAASHERPSAIAVFFRPDPRAHAAPSPPRAVAADVASTIRTSTSAAPRHERLAARADAGDADAALELSNMLDACATRAETRAIVHVIASDTGDAPACADADACTGVERLYDEFERSMQDWRDAERECAEVPADWLDARGRWLQRAAELGDPEAMACYAVAGVELAPSSFHASYASYIEHWRAHALGYAWEAWDRGEPRAAVALARLYAQPVGARADAVAAADPDPRLAFRFALVVTRALDLDPTRDDLAAFVEAQSDALAPGDFADEDAWAAARIPALERRLALPSRTPSACWQHFASFENREERATAMR